MWEPDLSETAKVRKLGSKASFIEILSKATDSLPDPTVPTLQSLWPTLLGDELAHRTRAVAADKYEITVETDARWVTSMRSMGPQILRKINYASPWNFKKIRFIEGEFQKLMKPIEGAEPFSMEGQESLDKNLSDSKADLDLLDADLQSLASSILKHIIQEK